ncbi:MULTISPECIES: transglutaminase-like domain-containing protein [unclassified Vibrio]|uniref:transglutaminase-like domain-containing protein n=1 Tax=unclassified Vibrio TaxID=2614977 RepID=UPI0012687AB7|nr:MULTISPECIES: transglutaminase-like domain-containing protein [unclassified Vibrio]QFT40068.1 hypothetical protein FIU99_27130 [Vibrio sp. THAF64]QGM38013.1 hypothetical protein GGC04_27335 [Vibrio sp. THAF191d]QGN73527.1 hypothetical protein GGC03_27440 [Vibrio sp. THAF191c]
MSKPFAKQLEFIHTVYEVKTDLLVHQPINKLPLETSLYRIAKALKPKVGVCYYNMAMLVLELRSRNIEATYVLGVSDLGVGFLSGHAWIEFDGKHYDPTLELGNSQFGLAEHYFEVKRYSASEIWDFVCEHDNLPPVFPDSLDESYYDREYQTEIRKRLKELNTYAA